MAMVAQDTFVADIGGVPTRVEKGSTWPDKHAVVKVDQGRGLLFLPLEEEPDPPKRTRRAAAPAAAEDEA